MDLEIINLKNKEQKMEIINFLENFDLKFDETIDYTIAIREKNKIVATASKSKNIIKCFAIDDSMRGEGVTNTLVTNLINKCFSEEISHIFVFTKPSNENIFKGVGFKLISKTDKVALLEMGTNSIEKSINKIKKEINWKEGTDNGLIIMNCNPFTLGHKFLIETAAKGKDNILILVVEEDKSSFPFQDRFNLVKKGVEHLKNVVVYPSTEYVISSATFPNYFLRKEDDSLLEFIKLDTKITAEYFCKRLGICTRIVGEEPYCDMTRKYNEAMKLTFEENGLDVEIIKRKKNDGNAISASQVREFLKNDMIDRIKEIVPEITYEYLISDRGKEIAQIIKKSNSVH